MKTPAAITLITVLIASCSSQKTRTANAPNTDAAIIRQLEYEAISAEFRLDTATIARVLHPDFIAVYPHKIQNKEEELSGIYSNIIQRKKDGETMDSLYLDDFRAQLYGNTAIVTFYTVTKGNKKSGPYEKQRWRWYDVWVKEKGEWKLVSAQGTPVTKSTVKDAQTIHQEVAKASDAYLEAIKSLHAKNIANSSRNNYINAVDKTLAVEYEYTDAEGKTFYKKDDLEYYKDPKIELATAEVSDRKIKIADNQTAVETGIISFTGRNNAKPFVYRKKYTTTWVFREGRWQIIADHASEIK